MKNFYLVPSFFNSPFLFQEKWQEVDTPREVLEAQKELGDLKNDVLNSLGKDSERNMKLSVLENGKKVQIESFEQKTSFLVTENGPRLEGLNIQFSKSKEGWSEIIRTANLLNKYKKVYGGDSKHFQMDGKNLEVDVLWPLPDTDVLSEKAFDKFPSLKANVAEFVRFLNTTIGSDSSALKNSLIPFGEDKEKIDWGKRITGLK